MRETYINIGIWGYYQIMGLQKKTHCFVWLQQPGFFFVFFVWLTAKSWIHRMIQRIHQDVWLAQQTHVEECDKVQKRGRPVRIFSLKMVTFDVVNLRYEPTNHYKAQKWTCPDMKRGSKSYV